MDQIKEAFKRVKEDIELLKMEVFSLKDSIKNLKNLISEINTSPEGINPQQENPTQNHLIPTNRQENPTQSLPINPQEPQFSPFSIGNQGVPTNRQTDKQTNRHIINKTNSPQNLDNALEILNSLDSIKKEIRLKFKELTDQEFLVFSTIYQIEEEGGIPDYKLLSKKMNLSESSIRDYVGRIMRKGIPVDKTKINNKNIQLSISQNLKNLVSLNAILQLRDL
ncbi:MAG: hypothetical protein KGH55_00830 [Nanoarchaeota archaeon]|nr:hypothetical protein [Nanoarchaeota archaeon]